MSKENENKIVFKKGFAVYLLNNEYKIPKSLIFFNTPVDMRFSYSKINLCYDHKPFLKELYQAASFEEFTKNFSSQSKKNIIIYISKLTVAASLWQLGFNVLNGDSNNLLVNFFITGFFSSLGLNMVNTGSELLLLKKPLVSSPGSILSLFPTVLLFDGIWQMLWQAGEISNNKLLRLTLHTLFYALASTLFIPIQAKFTQRIDFRYPQYRSVTYKPTLSITPLLTFTYVAFGYLPGLISSDPTHPLFAGAGVLIASAAWGLIESVITSLNLKKLTAEYHLFLSSPDQISCSIQESIMDESNFNDPESPPSLENLDELDETLGYHPVLDDAEIPPPLRRNTCELISDLTIDVLTSPFRFGYGIFSCLFAKKPEVTRTPFLFEKSDDSPSSSQTSSAVL